MIVILDWTQLTQDNPEAARSKTKQEKLNQAINAQSKSYIADTLLPRLIELMGDTCELLIDTDDPHTINITYPQAFASTDSRPQVRLEIGPLAAMLPMEWCEVEPYAATYFPAVFKQARISVPTILVARTFWEKLTILTCRSAPPK